IYEIMTCGVFPQWVGSPCGLHGPYVFYKAFRFHLDGKRRILSLGDFFLVRCLPGEPLCIAELQLLWEERTNQQLLSSSKLYFLPEDTPQGRTVNHGEDEVIAVSEKVIVRLEDLVKWTVWDSQAWSRGMKAIPLKRSVVHRDGAKTEQKDPHFLRYRDSTLNSGLNFKDVLKEKAELGEDLSLKRVLVLSYPQYCRYRSVLARLRERPPSLLTDQVVLALGGIAALSDNTHILYCRDTFDHPTLLHNESVCDEFAPNLKGRPRKKKPSISLRRDSQSQGQGWELKEGRNSAKVQLAGGEGGGEECRAEEQAFLVSLYKYMKERKTPIERIPYLGFKQINLWTMFQAAQKLGGYELITARRQWKNVYDELGGNPGSTSAATCTRRHYERLILPYERFTKGEEDKPLPQTKPRKQEAGSSAESPGDVSGPTPKTKLTNGLKQPAQKPHPERDVALATKVQDKNASIFMTRLDPPQLPHTKQERQSPGEENAEKGKEIQLILNEEKERRKRRSSGCEPSYLPTPAVTNESVLPFGTPKVLNHSHPAMDIWQQDQAAVKDQCHVGMISPTLKLRSLQSPTVPDPPSERANLPRREETYLGFTSILYPPRVNPQIMSPLAKKKLLSQVSGTGVPNHNHFPSSFGPPPPLISSSLTNGINEEPVGQPVTAMDSSVAVLNRPSVIQHAQSFKLRGMDERYDGVQRDRGIEREERAPSPTRSHEHHLPRPSPPMLAPEMPRPSRTPPGFISDLYSPSSHLQSLYRKVESHPSQGKGQGLSLPKDTESSASFLPVVAHHEQTYSTNIHLQDKSNNSNHPRTAPTDDQPTDLSLPKSSSLKPHPHASSSHPLPQPMMHKESTHLPNDATSPPVFQNGHRAHGTAYQPRACRVPPMTVSTAHTPALVLNSQVNDPNHAVRPILGSKVTPQNICAARPLKRPLEELENGTSERKIRAVTPMHASSLSSSSLSVLNLKDAVISSSPPRKTRTPEELDDDSARASAIMKSAPVVVTDAMHTAHVHIGSSFVEGNVGGPKGSTAAPFPLLPTPTTPHIYPTALYPAGAFALSQVPDLCRDTLRTSLTTGYPPSSHSHPHHPLQYLKNQSAAVLSPLVPPFAIHSFMMQRQLLAQAAASPTHMYQHPVAAATSYGELLHHGLYPMSINPQPTFSPPQLSSVHPSTKLS
uniref:AT-rich interactive domain-containing protein 5B n=1 Tax=Myripristis murdjan TaxID=586833 RepID=A0A667X5L4_9TELE